MGRAWFVVCGCSLGCMVCSFISRDAAVTFDQLRLRVLRQESHADFVDRSIAAVTTVTVLLLLPFLAKRLIFPQSSTGSL